MTMPRWTGCGVLACALLALAGCQKVNYEKSLSLTPDEVQLIDFDGPRGEQKITVTISSAGAPVNAYLVRKEDAQTAKECVLNGKPPPKPFDSKEKAEEITLNATIPPQTGYTLVLSPVGKKAEVKVKVSGK
jgi:hypothetical protein